MARAAAVIDQLTATRAQLDSACHLLLSPTADSVERCSVLLERASDRMVGFRPEMAAVQGDAAAMEEAWKVRRSFQRATRLLENAARFHRNWETIRGVMTGGYTNRGEPAQPRHPGRVCLEA
jgi:hypothetical protein